MKAYLAILKDSFREALASRVLLIALIGIVVVLLLLAPFGLSTDKATELRRGELKRPERFLQKLVAGENETDTPAAHLWSIMTTQQQNQAMQLLEPPDAAQPGPRHGLGGGPLKRQLVNQINRLLAEEQFYEATVWERYSNSSEVTELNQQQDLTVDQQKRRNLLLLAAAFSADLDVSESNAISLNYASASVIGPIPLTPSEFAPILDRVILAVIGVFLGFFGVFGSLLVTAGVIPRSFEPGEIALLLSKPVRRSLLLLTKFLGGCTFTLLYATVLVVGIWLLLGFRMNIWNHRLLWCIPVYVFLFMIYFSVSAVAGVIWRNSIVALALVVVFWIGLTVIGVTENALKENLIRQRGIKEIVSVGTEVLTVDGEQNVYSWDEESRTWQETFEVTGGGLSGFARRFLASSDRFLPVYDSETGSIFALQAAPSRFGGLGAPELVAGAAENDWERMPQGRVPDACPAVLMASNGRILLPTRQAIFEFVGQSEQQRRRAGVLGALTGGLLTGASTAFREVHVGKLDDAGEDFAAAIDNTTNHIYVFGKGTLRQFTVDDDGNYSAAHSREFKADQPAVLCAANNRILVAFGDGTVTCLNADDFEVIHSEQLPNTVVPRLCSSAPDGSWFAVLAHDGSIHLFDATTGKRHPATFPETGHCTALAWSMNGNLLLSDGRLQVTEYDPETRQNQRQWSESTSWVYQLYDYVIHPAWTVLPRPSQLDQFVNYIMSGERTVITNEVQGPPGLPRRRNLQQDREVFEPTTVLLNNLAFIIVMLGIGCFYVARSDF